MFLQLPVPAVVYFCPYSLSLAGFLQAGQHDSLCHGAGMSLGSNHCQGSLVPYIGLRDRNLLAFPLMEALFLKTIGENLATLCIPP